MQSKRFGLSAVESENIFFNITETNTRMEALKVKLRVTKLRTAVYQAVKSVLIEKARLALERASLTPALLFKNYGAIGREGTLDEEKFKKALKENNYDI